MIGGGHSPAEIKRCFSLTSVLVLVPVRTPERLKGNAPWDCTGLEMFSSSCLRSFMQANKAGEGTSRRVCLACQGQLTLKPVG